MSQFIPTADPIDAVPSFRKTNTKKMTGVPLVATWTVLVAAPWVVIYQVAKLVF